jgi:hypothetical protein
VLHEAHAAEAPDAQRAVLHQLVAPQLEIESKF